MVVSWLVLGVLLGKGQTSAILTPKKIGTTGLTLKLPEGELQPAADSSETSQTYRMQAQGVDIIITYRQAPEGVVIDPDFAANAAADQLPHDAETRSEFRPVGISGLQGRRITRGPLAAALYIQAGQQSWRVLTRIKDSNSAKLRDAILDSASVELQPPSTWKTLQLKDTKITACLPIEPDITLGSVPNLFRMFTFTSVTDASIITLAQIDAVKGKGPTLAKQIKGLDVDLNIPADAEIRKKSIQPLNVSGIDGFRVDYEFRLGETDGVFSALLLVRGDSTWRILVSRKKSDSNGANTADWVLNSIRIAK